MQLLCPQRDMGLGECSSDHGAIEFLVNFVMNTLKIFVRSHCSRTFECFKGAQLWCLFFLELWKDCYVMYG